MKKVCFFVIMFFSLFSFSSYILAGKNPSYKKLCKFLKEVPNWEATECSGMNVSGSNFGNIVTAQRNYSQGNKNINVLIISGSKIQTYWVPFEYNMQMETPEEFAKITTINGFKVGIQYFKKDSNGVIVVLLNKKTAYLPAGIVFSFSNMNWKEALEFAKKFDWNALKAFFE